MGVYDRQIATAQRLITAKGAELSWRVYRDAAPSGLNPRWLPTDPVEDDIVKHTVNIVIFPLSGGNGLYDLLAKLAGTEIQTSNGKPNLEGFMPAVSFDPSTKDVIRGYGDTDLRISSMKKIAPNGETILWILKLIQ